MTIYCFQVANAGVNEIGDYLTPRVKNGQLEKPTMATVDVNLTGSIYSKSDPTSHMSLRWFSSASTLAAHLAIHFLELGRKPDDTLKSIVLIGSMGGHPGCFCQLNMASYV